MTRKNAGIMQSEIYSKDLQAKKSEGFSAPDAARILVSRHQGVNKKLNCRSINKRLMNNIIKPSL